MKTMTKYDQTTEALMVAHFTRQNEPQRRQYAYVEAQKLGYGGKAYIQRVLGISQKALRKGEKELNNSALLQQIPDGRQRRAGGGRKKICHLP